MSPPPLPSFPLLTSLGTLLPSPPPPPPPPPRPPSSSSPYPRDPRTGNTLWRPISRADHVRQRLKLVRAQHALVDEPTGLATLAETALAKRQVRYAALHAARRDKKDRDEADRRARRSGLRGDDPYSNWDTPAFLPEDAFYRPPVPRCVAVLTGIPTLAWRYGAVCMVHPVRRDPTDPLGRRGIPVFAGEITTTVVLDEKGEEVVVDATPLLRKFDPKAREDRTETFDLVRVERAVQFAAAQGKRDKRRKCLRCRVRGLPCSLERRRNVKSEKCEGCRRNEFRYCLRVVWDGKTGRAEDDKGPVARYEYVSVKKTGGLGKKKVDLLVYVRDAEVDVEEVRRCAEELLDGDGRVKLWGAAVDAAAVALPSWKDGYCKSLARKNKFDADFVRRWNGDAEVPEKKEIDKGAVTRQDYFRLLHEKWRFYNPYAPREPGQRRVGELPSEAEIARMVEDVLGEPGQWRDGDGRLPSEAEIDRMVEEALGDATQADSDCRDKSP